MLGGGQISEADLNEGGKEKEVHANNSFDSHHCYANFTGVWMEAKVGTVDDPF